MRLNAFRAGFIFAMIAFGVTLAIIIGQRLSSEAMAVLLGVVTGIVSSIPTSLLIVWIATRNISKKIENVMQVMSQPSPTPPTPEPKIVLVSQPSPVISGYATQQGWAPTAASPMNPPRRFTVIGGSDESSVHITEID